jgi:hypothetical protein
MSSSGAAAAGASGALYPTEPEENAMHVRGRSFVAGMVLGLVLLFGAEARGQIDTAAIVGTVRDQTGAVVPGATVTATQAGTEVAVSVVTNAAGQYTFPALRIGTYAVAAELSGFRRMVRPEVRLNVQDRVEVNFSLEVGELAEEVVVSGRQELLQTQTADIGTIIDARQLQDLPLLGRRYSELAFLTPGVVVAPAGITSRGEDTFFNANGNYATWNNYTLDGADNNSFSTNLQERSPQVVQPPIDALQEFKVQTRTYSAEFGKAAGAVINASIKSGSNQFRGNVYDFFRNERFNANTWDANRVGLPKGPYNQHIAGGTLGGPIQRNRTFFFGSYQATRTEQTLTQTATVPTALMRTGDLREMSGSMTATNPFVPAGCVDAANKRINPACIDPVAAKLLSLYPMPNAPGTSSNYVSNGILNHNIDQFDLRVDNQISQRDQVFVRYSFQNTKRNEPPVLDDPVASGDFASDMLIRGQNVVGSWSRIIGNNVFSETRVAYNRVRSDSVHLSFGVDANAEYGIRGVPNNPQFYGGLPHMAIAGVTRLGGPFFRPQFQTSQVYQFSQNFTWNKGNHTYKAGLERRRDNVWYIDLRSLNGELGFSNARYTGLGFGDFLLGMATTQRLTLFHAPDLYTDGWQVYAQDSWRVSPNVTVNYGLRYEYFTPMFDREGRLTNVDPATGQLIHGSTSGSVFDRTLIHPDRNDFAPRAGVAWTMTPRTVLRGGYGIFYQQTDRYGSESQMGLNLPQLVDVAISATSANQPPAFTFAEGFISLSPENISPAVVQWRIQDPDQRTPIVHQFSVGPEVQLGSTMVAAVEYVGNRVRNGRRLRNLNQGIIVTPGVGPVVFPYAEHGYGSAYLQQITTVGRSDYNALQTRLQRRYSGGLAFTLSYTWSQALGDFLDHLSAGGGATGNTPKNAYAMEEDYGPLPFDITHRFVASFIYDLPVGPDRAFNPGGAAGAVLGGWSVNGILSLDGGRPFSISANDRANAGPGRRSAANCIGDPLPSGFTRTRDQWFDTSAFAENTPFTYGNCGYNTMRGPGRKAMNMSLFRNFRLPNDRRLEFRAEAFNVFNWINWGLPGSSASNLNTFGRITGTQGDPRQMQFAVKFYF